MDDVLAKMSHDVFLTYMGAGVFTEDEIAEKFSAYARTATVQEKLDLANAVVQAYSAGSVMGLLRTAIRSLYGLPPGI